MPLKPLTGKGSRLNLPSLGLSLRVLFTGFLIVASIGLISAGGHPLLVAEQVVSVVCLHDDYRRA